MLLTGPAACHAFIYMQSADIPNEVQRFSSLAPENAGISSQKSSPKTIASEITGPGTIK
jgi:hypothetical protein